MSNSSQDQISNMLFNYGSWSILGFVIGTSNLLIFLSIAKHKALLAEKEYVLLMHLAFADTLTMLGYISAGVYRLWVVLSGRLGHKVSMLWCFFTPHTILWQLTDHLAQLMLVCISCDRLYLVCKPVSYLTRSRKYALRVVLAAYSFTITVAVVSMTMEFAKIRNSNATTDSRCFAGFNAVFQTYYSHGAPAFAFASVLIFVAVFPAYKLNQNKVEPKLGGKSAMKAKLAKQRKMTRTLAVSCACTFFLYCIPHRLAYLTYLWGYIKVSQSLWLVCLTNNISNMVIYQLRHPELHIALKNLFIGKDVPPVLTLWPKMK